MINKKLSAPIDGKNVTTDWIEEIFDFQTGLFGKGCVVGFVSESPVIATWSDNVLTWRFPNLSSVQSSKELKVLQERLGYYDGLNTDLISEYSIKGDALIQKFFWNEH